jgi:hypothetical protein
MRHKRYDGDVYSGSSVVIIAAYVLYPLQQMSHCDVLAAPQCHPGAAAATAAPKETM